MNKRTKHQPRWWIILAILVFHYTSAWSEELFRDVSDEVGLTWTEGGPYEVLYANWTDVNTDGFPDLWVMPHGMHWDNTDYIAGPQLFINQAGTSFVDMVNLVWPEQHGKGRDAHAANWGDFNNDGNPDVFINGGGALGTNPSATHERTLLVNEGGILVDHAQEFELSPLLGSGRGSLWLDWNKDGWLDLMYFTKTVNNNVIHPSKLFAQTDLGFVDMTKRAGLILNREMIRDKDIVLFGVVSDLFGDNVPEIMLFGSLNPSFLVRVYRNETAKLKNLSNQFPKVPLLGDAVVADFNQDTVPDIFITQNSGFSHSMIVHEEDKSYILGRFDPATGQEHGMSFKNFGAVTFDCQSKASSIFVGKTGISPNDRFFTLSPTDTDVQGLSPRSQSGTYIGYDPLTKTWTVLIANSSNLSEIQEVDVTAQSDFSEVTALNFTPPNPNKNRGRLPIYLEYDSELNKYVERTVQAGFIRNLFAYTVVTGDFDNDMDLDLYIRQALNNRAPMQSVYYENQGDGSFVEVANAKGATVSIRRAGFCIPYGYGPIMAVADYDQNGFLDIFTAAEVRMTYSRHFHVGVPTRLFQNQGNGNHWLQIDLVGTVSARDAIGAKVLVHTPDGKVQVRMQDGGHHLGGQNQHRLHFGLGANTLVVLIEVVWPNGNVSTLNEVAVDQILPITEPVP
ncbi:MAG: hypothetical protein BWK78_08045 [Thiotrichaceae bacterium IS1]|nr:MAG: hypothetical protein BWK78_08045 [Thiotrichaceae bacterium IS1]